MEIIKTIRKRLGIKQTELARMLNIREANYCNMENGRLVPKNIKEIEQKAFSKLLAVCEGEIMRAEEEIKLHNDIKSQIINQTPF